MNVRSIVPNLFTSANLVFGCLAIIQIFDGNLQSVIYYTFLAGIADFFDGFMARLFKANSNIGKDLDSLADMVSFGMVPAFTLFMMMKQAATSPDSWLPYLAFLMAVMSALRLAKFNNDERQSHSFYGLPTPANALIICALPLLSAEGILVDFLQNNLYLAIIAIVSSIIMIVDIPLIALKFKHYRWKENELKYILIVTSIIGVSTYQIVALPFLVVFYFFGSVIAHWLSPKN
jgi:CDP-diacylglycerol--serine O-phosphatidyltransferase